MTVEFIVSRPAEIIRPRRRGGGTKTERRSIILGELATKPEDSYLDGLVNMLDQDGDPGFAESLPAAIPPYVVEHSEVVLSQKKARIKIGGLSLGAKWKDIDRRPLEGIVVLPLGCFDFQA